MVYKKLPGGGGGANSSHHKVSAKKSIKNSKRCFLGGGKEWKII